MEEELMLGRIYINWERLQIKSKFNIGKSKEYSQRGNRVYEGANSAFNNGGIDSLKKSSFKI